MQRCAQTNGNGVACQRRTGQWLDWVPLCDAHYRQAMGGRRDVPIEWILGSWADRAAVWLADPAYRAGLREPVATHANRRPLMGEVQRGWVLDLGDGYGWAEVTKVEQVTPRDGLPRVRLHFLTEQDQRPQHTVRADEPCYPYRRPQQGAA